MSVCVCTRGQKGQSTKMDYYLKHVPLTETNRIASHQSRVPATNVCTTRTLDGGLFYLPNFFPCLSAYTQHPLHNLLTICDVCARMAIECVFKLWAPNRPLSPVISRAYTACTRVALSLGQDRVLSFPCVRVPIEY